MKILITGAFGNVGESTLKALLSKKADYEITCFDKGTFGNRRVAGKFRKEVKIIWGDIRDKKKVAKAVKDKDIILHIAAVIPPKANKNKKRTLEINFGGTKNIVNATKQQKNPPKILYTSSVAVYGDVRDRKSPLIYENEPFNPSPGDHYAVTKIKAEEYVRNSGLEWTVFRLSYIPNSRKIKLTPLMFRMPLDTPVEFTHTEDCGLCLANAIESDKVWNNIFNLGGGENCRFIYGEFLGKMLPLMGVSELPDEAFSNESFHCCYYDTKKLQNLLQFQNHDLNDLLEEMKERGKGARKIALMLRPIIKPFLLLLSPYYRKNIREKKKKGKTKFGAIN